MFKIAPEGFSLRDLDPWSELYEAKERGSLVEALIVRTRRENNQEEAWELEFPGKPGITGYVPASENGLPEGSPINEFVGQKILVKVKSIDRENDMVECSRKESVDISLFRLLNQLEEGEVINSVVRVVARRSVYLDIGGGVILRINRERARLSHGVPLDVQYEVGAVIKAKVIRLDKENKNIELEPVNPWEVWDYNRGEVVLGKVVAIRDNHAYISVKPGIVGRVMYKKADNYGVGDFVEFQVVSYNRAKRHLHLVKWDARRTAERRRERGRIRAQRAETRKTKGNNAAGTD